MIYKNVDFGDDTYGWSDLLGDIYKGVKEDDTINPYKDLSNTFESILKRENAGSEFKIKETDKCVTLRLNVPGHKAESIKVTSKGNELRIDAINQHPDVDDVIKVYTMGEKLDWGNLTPKVAHGILTIKIPVKEESREKVFTVR